VAPRLARQGRLCLSRSAWEPSTLGLSRLSTLVCLVRLAPWLPARRSAQAGPHPQQTGGAGERREAANWGPQWLVPVRLFPFTRTKTDDQGLSRRQPLTS
jgi:hypothetical protein